MNVLCRDTTGLTLDRPTASYCMNLISNYHYSETSRKKPTRLRSISKNKKKDKSFYKNVFL